MIDRINSAFTGLELGVGEAHAKAVRGHPEFVVIDMPYGYHVCHHPEAVAAFVEQLSPDPSHKATIDRLSRGLNPFLVDEAIRDRVRWTGTGGHGPHFYGYREDAR